MAEMFRRISKYTRRHRSRVFVSQHNLVDEVSATEDRNRPRAHSQSRSRIESEAIINGYSRYPRRLAWQDGEAAEDRNEVLTREWMEKWQLPSVCPFGRHEFEDRVQAVKSAILMEMDQELARDMRSYNLVDRRSATCREMISSEVEKAACRLGILGF